MVSFFVDGVCFSVGIFFDPLREHFGSSKAQTAWVGSVLNGSYLIVGPVVSAFVNRYGCRKMAILGSTIAAMCFFISTFSPSLNVLIVTYGLLGGMAFGFVYLPAIVMVGYYFEKRRALATGVACCGSGIGAFIFAPLCNVLLEEYGWRGATWIISAIVLNAVIFSIFYRPLESKRPDSNQDAQNRSKEKSDVRENGEVRAEQARSLLGGEVDEEKRLKKNEAASSARAVTSRNGDVVSSEAVVELDVAGQDRTLSMDGCSPSTTKEAPRVVNEGGFDRPSLVLAVPDIIVEAPAVCSTTTQERETQDRFSDLIKTVTPQIRAPPPRPIHSCRILTYAKLAHVLLPV